MKLSTKAIAIGNKINESVDRRTGKGEFAVRQRKPV